MWPEPSSGEGANALRYRFQWTAPIALSPHDPNVLYHCGNRIFRTRDEGETWEAISPDLTRNDPAKLRPSGGPVTKDIQQTFFGAARGEIEKYERWLAPVSD